MESINNSRNNITNESITSKIVENLLSIAEECDTRERLIELVTSGRKFVAYNGF